MKKVVMSFVFLSMLLVGTLGFCKGVNVNAYIGTNPNTGYSYYVTYIEPTYENGRISFLYANIKVVDIDNKPVRLKGGNGVGYIHATDGYWYDGGNRVQKGTLADKILRYSLEVLGERY